MSEWVVDVHSMIPSGLLEERLYVIRRNLHDQTLSIMHPGTLTTHPMDGTVPDVKPFMSGYPASACGKGEIDDFLQAMMDCAWKRGLRPAKFDPSAGELAAVKAHLDDMRRLAKVPDDAAHDDPAGTEKKW